MCALAAACSAAPEESSASDPPRPSVKPLGRPRCQAPAGVSNAPSTIEQSVQLLNALPKPTNVACFVESLARPLVVYASSSEFSAQPALSSVSPRLFIKLGGLWLSVVVAGESSYLMEFGQLIGADERRSLKGELLLPIAEAVPPSAPFDRVRYQNGTLCGLCHRDEQRDLSVDYAAAFASEALRPRPDTRVGLSALRLENELCDWTRERERCEMLSAVFDGGEVVEGPFPDAMPTFF